MYKILYIILLILILNANGVGAKNVLLIPEIKELIQIGNVQFKYLPELNDSRRGYAKFKFKWKRNFSYKYSFKYLPDKNIFNVNISAKVKETPTLVHTIEMPSKHIGKKWHDRLFRHEFDHVAISTDQRPILILSFLVAHLKINDIKVATKSQLTKAFLGKIINARIDLIENEVESLIRNNYRLLDSKSISDHGKKKILNRKGFFKNLYSHSNLVNQGFPFAEKVKDFLETKEYKNAKVVYF